MIRIDESEILELWQNQAGRLRNRIRKLVGDNGPVEDLLQDTFLKFYSNGDRIEQPWAIQYITKAASNTAIDYLRKQRNPAPLPDYHPVHGTTPYDDYCSLERMEFFVREVRPAIESLSLKKRQAIDAFVSESSLTRSAQELGLPVNTLKCRQNSAIADLRELLGYSTGYSASDGRRYK